MEKRNICSALCQLSVSPVMCTSALKREPLPFRELWLLTLRVLTVHLTSAQPLGFEGDMFVLCVTLGVRQKEKGKEKEGLLLTAAPS